MPAGQQRTTLARALARRIGPHLRRPMVRWFSPVLLVRTLALVLLARVFGAYADRREREAIRPADGPAAYPGDEIWLDYVADLGDGWDSTTSIATLIAAPALVFDGESLPAGRVLVMGGDQVYPSASREEYLHRLESPYYSVHPYSPEDAPRDLFALPGNHDWYDGLSAFSRLFLQGRWFAGWRTRQTRSYFALRLPQRWWFIAVDVQLDNDIDLAQRDYLLAATAAMAPGDRVILAAAQPWWFEAAGSALRRNLEFLERKLVTDRGAQVRVCVAGDEHHYQRHAREDGAQRVTAGGGGAFLHGTAWYPDRLPGDDGAWQREAAFPSPTDSRLSLWRLLLFPLFNPSFAFFLATLAMALLWIVDAGSNGIFFHNAGLDGGVMRTLAELLSTLPLSPAATLATGLWLAGFVAFAEAPTALPPRMAGMFRAASGTLHGMLQLGLACWFLTLPVPGAFQHFPGFFATMAALVVALAIASGLLFGAWVFVGYQLLGLHRDIAFSACRIADWKHFLRLHVRSDGALDIHVVTLRRVCRHWRWVAPGTAASPHVEPADGVPLARRASRLEKVTVRPE